jgi:glycosyltransferase involved in cell wall biosynthesis
MQLLDYQPAEQLAEVLSAADAALISQAEGMAELSLPYKFYGILAAGRPLIFVGPRESEIVRYTAEAGCGLHVEQGDAAGLAAALRRLADDPDARREMGRRARELFEARFTSDRAATAWTELIEQVR